MMERPDLPNPASNPVVWCDRCQRHHKRYTFTQDDLIHIVADGAATLAEQIDADGLRLALERIDQCR